MNEREIKKLYPNASASFLARNCDHPKAISSDNEKPTEGYTLVSPAPREAAGSNGPAIRFRIRFTVFAVRPCDWDGWHVKELQDLLVHAGILGGDEWNKLQGEVVSEKVHSKEQERTVIEIWEPTQQP